MTELLLLLYCLLLKLFSNDGFCSKNFSAFRIALHSYKYSSSDTYLKMNLLMYTVKRGTHLACPVCSKVSCETICNSQIRIYFLFRATVTWQFVVIFLRTFFRRKMSLTFSPLAESISFGKKVHRQTQEGVCPLQLTLVQAFQNTQCLHTTFIIFLLFTKYFYAYVSTLQKITEKNRSEQVHSQILGAASFKKYEAKISWYKRRPLILKV